MAARREPMNASEAGEFGAPDPRVSGWLQRLARDLRRRAGVNSSLSLIEWGRLYLPKHFKLSPSAMHVWLDDQLSAAIDRRGLKLNVIGPRGAAKSTLVTLAYVLRV